MNGLAALGFIVSASARNLVRRQLARVRQPRYLLAVMRRLRPASVHNGRWR